MMVTVFKQDKQDLSDLPEVFEDALEAWCKGGQILHAWDADEIAFVVVKFDNEIVFLRAVQIGSAVHVSRDQSIAL